MPQYHNKYCSAAQLKSLTKGFNTFGEGLNELLEYPQDTDLYRALTCIWYPLIDGPDKALIKVKANLAAAYEKFPCTTGRRLRCTVSDPKTDISIGHYFFRWEGPEKEGQRWFFSIRFDATCTQAEREWGRLHEWLAFRRTNLFG